MLTDAKVRAARPLAKSYKLTDSNRLFLLVTPRGSKLWRWNYYYDGKQKSMGEGLLVFPSTRHLHRPMSENALGYLLNRAGCHGHHVPHGFRAAVSTIMNEWAERYGKESDRAIIDLMLAHVPRGKVEGAYNRAAYMPRRRELARVWANMLCEGLPEPFVLVERPAQPTGGRPRRFNPMAVDAAFRFPVRRRAA